MRKALLITLGLLFVAGMAYASVGYKSSGVNVGQATDINCYTGLTCTFDGSTLTIVATGTSATPTITGGTANGFVIGTTSPAAGHFTTLSASGLSTLANITDTTIYSKASGSTLTQVLSMGVDGVIYGSGANLALDGANVGAVTPGTGKFTTLQSTGLSTLASLGVVGTSTLAALVDTTVYSASAGSGTAKYVCISLDGTIYGSSTTCH